MKNRIVALIAPFAALASGCGDVDSNMGATTIPHVRTIVAERTTSFTDAFAEEGIDVIVPEVASTTITEAKKSKSNPVLVRSFRGLNQREQRNANVPAGQAPHPEHEREPPDQALCVGNGFVVEGVNHAVRVRNTNGQPLSAPLSLNDFFDREPMVQGNDPNDPFDDVFGPVIVDPTCYFDKPTQRWFFAAVTREREPDGFPNGGSFLELAVSNSSNPLGPWTIYDIHAENDGTNNTPDHDCFGSDICYADFPHIGADQNGIYVTVDEFSFIFDGFEGANVYAFAKQNLVSLPSSVTLTLFRTKNVVDSDGDNTPDQSGQTLWPAVSPGNQYECDAGGAQYFLSSNANQKPFGETPESDQLIVWALTNTASLNTATPNLVLHHKVETVNTYRVPPLADQKNGPTPLRECLNDGADGGCKNFFFPELPQTSEELIAFSAGDARILTLTFANNKLWGALNTGISIGTEERVGAAWFILDPTVSPFGVSASVIKQGVLALPRNNVVYPSIAVTKSGRGVMAFSLSGKDHWPSAGYASIDAVSGVGAIQIAAEGVGPLDGLSGYSAFVFGAIPSRRFGDYGAAVADGNDVWIASEYIAQKCNLQTYIDTLGSCGNTRTLRANWATRITQLRVMGPP